MTKNKSLFLFSLAALFYILFSHASYASSYTELQPNQDKITRLNAENRVLNYKVTVDKKGFQYFEFTYLENPNNLIGDGFDIEVLTKDRKLIHGAYGIKDKYFGGYFAVKKGEELLIEIREQSDYVDPVNGIDTKFNFHTEASITNESEPNDNFSEATKLFNGGEFRGSLHSASDVDFYKYKVPVTGSTEISFQRYDLRHGFSKVEDGWNVEIFDTKKNLIYEKRGIVNYIFSGELKYKEGSTLFIKVSATNPEEEPYLADYKIIAITKNKSKIEAEDNNSFKKANKITSKRSGLLINEQDKDFFVFKAKKGGKYKIHLKTEKLDGKKYNLDFYQKKNGKAKYSLVAGGSASKIVKLKKGQKLWIRISGNKNNVPIASEYKLSISKK